MKILALKFPSVFFCVLCLCFSAFSQARAHAVYVDAWVEGGRMCAEGSFAGRTKAKNSTVTVKNEQGDTLREGATDDGGKVCFPLPEKPAKLTFILNAGQGHRAETNLYAEDFPAFSPSPAPPALSPADAPAVVTGGKNQGEGNLETLVREAVRQEMRQQLGPVRQSLAALQKKEPGLLEIFGGIGWIVGLAGAVALANSRGRKK